MNTQPASVAMPRARWPARISAISSTSQWTSVNRPSGRFTLIELLVVVTIIAILASMLLPGLSRAKQVAKRSLCTSQLHQLHTIYAMYAGDFDSYLPSNSTEFNQDDPMWMTVAIKDALVAGYNATRQLYDCPGVQTAPRTDRYFYGVAWGYGWDNPYHPTLASGGLVPTSYTLFAGRALGFRSLNTTVSIPLKVDHERTVFGGLTETPWLIDFVGMNSSNIATLPNETTDVVMHGINQVPYVLKDGSGGSKPYLGPNLDVATGDPDVLKLYDDFFRLGF